ncbi:MAG: Na+/H+ antiporter NhaD/arsenite permease-like protein [Paracoccaceae bacterium]|jgi:Na+/H+ antiporter NhaD/arsenite permease-like protein
MVWQNGVLSFWQFLDLFAPSLVNFIVSAAIMHFALPEGKPSASGAAESVLKHGGIVILGLFILTIVTAVCFYNFLHLPPELA